MKVMIPDPMTGQRLKEVEKVNTYFAQLDLAASHRERVYRRKRDLAQSVMDGARLPDDHPFVREASLRGLPQEEFARDVIYKPDTSGHADERELERQRILLRIKAAKTPGELAEVMHEAALPVGHR